MEVLAPSHCASRRAERSDESVSASEAEGFRGRYHSIHGRVKQGAGRHCGKGSDVCKEGGGREGLEAVDHGRRERGKKRGDGVMQLLGRDISGMQQERSRRLCNQRGNVRRGLEDDNEAAGSKRNTGGKKCDLRLSSARKNQAFQKNHMRIGVRKLLRMGWVPCDSVERTNIRHLARTQVGVEAAEGGSSRQERVSFVISLHEGERFGG